MERKKGAMTLGDAPVIVLIVGLTFLVLATVALVGEKYQNSFPSDTAGTATGESISLLTGSATLAQTAQCNADDFAVLAVTNGTAAGYVINSANYTFNTETGVISNLTSTNGNTWNINYTYTFTPESCNVTKALSTTIGDNTSIAGLILTISLVGIVLGVLIMVFMGIRRNRI